MLEFYEPGATIIEESVANAASQRPRRTSGPGFRVRCAKGISGEMVFAGNEVLDRACTETHLLAEFGSKMAADRIRSKHQDNVQGMQPAPGRLYPS